MLKYDETNVWRLLIDPQHEPRGKACANEITMPRVSLTLCYVLGWYGVYHNDTTMSVIENYAKSIVSLDGLQ
jgi:hypothetical protein